MLIDCDRCEMRDIACPDCVVTALLGHGRPEPGLDADERRALRALAGARLISAGAQLISADGQLIRADAQLVSPLPVRPVARAS